MDTEFVRFLSEDGIELQGLFFTPDAFAATRGIVHVHGLASNFYENRFIDYLANAYTKQGYAFLSFNNRGHDYLSDLLQKEAEGWTLVNGGGAYELIADTVYDIEAALAVMIGQGVHEICLQGHSFGANKVVYYQAKQQNRHVKCIILLSPGDDLGLQQAAIGEGRYEEQLELASRYVQEGKGEQLLPEGSFFSYPITAQSYLDYFDPSSERDVFRYRTPAADFNDLSQIQQPTLALFGNSGEYVLGDIRETLVLLQSKATSSPRFDIGIVDGAPHDYLGEERQLAQKLVGWLADVMPDVP